MSGPWKTYSTGTGTLDVNTLGENHCLTQQLKLIPENTTVLEFGCATGYFSYLMKQKGCRVTGIEGNPEAARQAQPHCEKVIVADLDFVSLAQALPNQPPFDVAVFGDILEHLRNPWKLLAETRQFLKPDGCVVASIPNVAHGAVRLALLQGRFDYVPFGLLDSSHLRFFTHQSLAAMFDEAGYFIEHVTRTCVSVFADFPLIPQLNRDDFPPEVIAMVESSPEAETLQFILKAVPLFSADYPAPASG